MCDSGVTPRDTEGADLHVRESLSRSPCGFREEMGHDWATGLIFRTSHDDFTAISRVTS
jgi:hypothetical protein